MLQPPSDRGGYWVISTAKLRLMLERARAGEDVDLLIMEEYANSVIERDDPPLT